MLEPLREALRRTFSGAPAPAYVLIRPDHARRCPECSSSYAAMDRYCPRCKTVTPEWRFG